MLKIIVFIKATKFKKIGDHIVGVWNISCIYRQRLLLSYQGTFMPYYHAPNNDI